MNIETAGREVGHLLCRSVSVKPYLSPSPAAKKIFEVNIGSVDVFESATIEAGLFY